MSTPPVDHGAVVDAVLAFDDAPELLTFRFTHGGMLMWPFIRWQLYRSVVETVLGREPAHATSEKRTLGERLDYVVRSTLRSPLSVRRTFDLVVFGTSAGIVLERDGKWFDRINDYFTAEYPERTLAVDAAYRKKYKHPRFPPHTCCHDGIALAGALADRLRPVSAADEATIARFVAFLTERFTMPLTTTLDGVRRALRMWAARLPVLAPLYRRFFARVQPRLIFVEDGHYGGWSHLLVWAREAGIATAELQHGSIARSHLAYRYGGNFRRAAELARCLPQYLLVYGDYWATQVDTPAECVVIGNPHFTERRAELRARPRPASPAIVVVSQGGRTARMVALTEAIAAHLPHRTVVFRPHAGEVPHEGRYAHLRRISNVRIADRGDIYECFATADSVVGWASTALVEADGCGLAVYVDDDETSRAFLPEGLGCRFTTADELVRLLHAGTGAASHVADYWADDWQARYRAFVDGLASRGSSMVSSTP